MRPPRPALLATLTAIVLLSACGSGHHSTTPNPGSTTSSSAPTRSTASSTSAPTTVAPSSSTSPPSSAPAQPGPRIVSFTGPPPPVECNAPTSVELHWVTSANTKSVDLQIDGGPVFATYTNGRHDELVPLACDGTPQTYKLTAHAANGQSATKSLKLSERKSL